MDTPSEDALFGGWLRRRRKALDLTQKELARRIGCSPATIRKLEADERRPSKHVAATIARVLGVADAECDAFVTFARSGWSDAPPAGPARNMERPWLNGVGNGKASPGPRQHVANAAPDRTPAPAPTPTTADDPADAPRFLAREAELARLDTAVRAAVAGRGGVVLLAGEAGQGKTSLMRAFASRALGAHPELLAVTGTCNAYTGQGDAFAPFREILRQLTGEEPPATALPAFDATLRARLAAFAPRAVSALLEHGPHLLDTFVPASLLRIPNGRAGEPTGTPDVATTVLDLGTASTGNAALRAEAIAVLTRLTTEAPLLLLLDDLQWSDPSSLELLLQLARVAERQRLVVVGALRPGRTDRDDAGGARLGHAVDELKRQYGDVVLDLGRADARAFLEAWIDSEPNTLDASFREALWRQTGGQPLFTVELLRAMQDRGDLVRDAHGRWTEGPDLRWDALPGRVAGALGVRIARLDEAANAVLRVAAIEGEVFTAELVARVLELAPVDVARVLNDTLDRGHRLVAAIDVRRTADDQRISRYRFRHNLIQRYVLEQIGTSERGYLHEAVANGAAALLGEEADPLAVAFHFSEAQAPRAAAPYYRRAGDRARRAGAVTEAIAAYREAARHWPDADGVGLAPLLRDLGQCLFLHGEREAAEEALERARASFDLAGDHQGMAATRALLATVEFDERPQDRPALEAYEQALAVLEGTPGVSESLETAQVLLQMAPRYVDYDNERARAMAERALSIAERRGAEDEHALALVKLGDIIADTVPERREEGRRMIEEGLVRARRGNVIEAVTYGTACLAVLDTGLGRLDEAAAGWRELLRLAETSDLQLVQRTIPARLFALEWRRGRWRSGTDRFAAMHDGASRHPVIAFQLALAELDLGRAPAARALIRLWEADLAPELIVTHRATVERARLRSAVAFGEQGRADQAAFGFLAAAGRHPTYGHHIVAAALYTLRWLVPRTGQDASDGVSSALDIVETAARQWGSPETAATLASARGLVAWHDGDLAAAERSLAEAAEAWATTGYPLDEARAHSTVAMARQATGNERGAEEARARATELLDGLASQLPQGELAASFANERLRILDTPLALP